MKKFHRTSALMIAVICLAVLLAGCGGGSTPTPAPEDNAPAQTPQDNVPAPAPEPINDSVLVIGTDATFSEKWNPFLAESAYDNQVLDQVFTSIMQLNDKNELVPFGGNCVSEVQDDGGVLYTITVNEGMKFTDGQPVTIDDYIYGVYVRSDPSYTGPNNTLNSHIEGIEEYYYDNANYSSDIAAIEADADKYAPGNITWEDWLVYARATDLEGEWSGDPADYPEYLESEGFGEELAAIDQTNADAMFELFAKCEYENYAEYYGAQDWFVNKAKQDYAMANVSGGVDVAEISGIKKINDYTCTVKVTLIDIYADRGLALPNGMGKLAPKHYYGDFTKGDVSKILSNMDPIGSGPYIWGGFSDNIATCTANPDFFKGAPKTGTVRWQYVPQSDIISKMAAGEIDIANPSTSKANVDELESQGLTYFLVDNAGYGYMGMNCKTTTVDVRRGLWSLMNRKPAVEAYYGNRAEVIERPMTTVLAEYPQDAKEMYPYNTTKALEYFEAAGYTQQNGKLVDTNGNQLVVNCYIGGDGAGDHPAYPMLVQAANDMATLGGEIQIQDVNFGVLSAAVDDYTADMWIMAWADVYDCDKTTQFHTTGGQNNYQYSDPKMDALLETIIQTIDLNERRKLVAEMLDLAMDQCIEYPIYQRKNLRAYNPMHLNMDTIPEATAFYSYEQVLYQVEMIP